MTIAANRYKQIGHGDYEMAEDASGDYVLFTVYRLAEDEAAREYHLRVKLQAEVESLKAELRSIQKSQCRCTCQGVSADPYCRYHGGL